MLKYCSKSLAHPLSILFELSYNTGDLPTDWKNANIVPIHKKGSKEDIENYRPISLTSLVIKVFERIIKEELLYKTSHLLDDRQHGFLKHKSCTTNMLSFTDNIVMSINDCSAMSIDVVYFDFSKAFDSVNHDIILQKLKYFYNIDGRLLKFLKNYLCGRKQCVVIDNCKSVEKDVRSGVPQGSIIGPILFVLFINDMPQGINDGTHLALYADDTKIWRKITSELDLAILQKDIDYLYLWSKKNKINFHPKKCKVVSINHKLSPLSMLPFTTNNYQLGENLLAYADSEKDLGVDITNNFTFNQHCTRIISTANQKYGLLRRTCSFVNDIQRRRILYLTLVRSQFEHCSQIWWPSNNKTLLDKLENIQKKCIRWILSEEELSYSDRKVYIQKCKQINVLPIGHRLILNDMILFHKIAYHLIPIAMPSYLLLFSGNTRLRTTHLDRLCYVSSVLPKGDSLNTLNKSFFYRSNNTWNSMPLELRELRESLTFKMKLRNYLWERVIEESHDADWDDNTFSDCTIDSIT